MLDRYVSGTSNRLSPEAPVPLINEELRYHSPGGAANVAVNMAELGGSLFLCGFIGQDQGGKLLREKLKGHRIDQRGILVTPHRKTTEKTRIIANGHQVARIDNEDNYYLDPEEEEKILGVVDQIMKEHMIHIIVFQDYNKGVLTPTIIEKVIKLGREKNSFLAADPKTNHFFLYKNMDLFKPNLSEFSTALKRKVGTSQMELKKVSEELIKKISCKTLMVTLAEKGIFIMNGSSSTIEPAIDMEIADVSGAGDTVVSVAAHALYEGFSGTKTARLCNLAASIVCGKPGVTHISSDKLFLINES